MQISVASFSASNYNQGQEEANCGLFEAGTMFLTCTMFVLMLLAVMAVLITVPLAVLRFQVVKAKRYTVPRMPPYLRVFRAG